MISYNLNNKLFLLIKIILLYFFFLTKSFAIENNQLKGFTEGNENAKITIRNNRRDALDRSKILEKEKEISQDDLKKQSSEVQKITDKYILQIDDIFNKKKTEILTV